MHRKRGVIYVNYVEPIRDLDKFDDILSYLKEKKERDYVLILTQYYTNLRITDVLKLQVKHVSNLKEIRLREDKTNKLKSIPIYGNYKKVIEGYIEGKSAYEYLFPANGGRNKPITRQRAYQIIKDVANKFGIQNIGTHSMRKTFGYHYYNETKDIGLLQTIFNHSSPATTLRYIGINKDKVNDAYREMEKKIKIY